MKTTKEIQDEYLRIGFERAIGLIQISNLDVETKTKLTEYLRAIPTGDTKVNGIKTTDSSQGLPLNGKPAPFPEKSLEGLVAFWDWFDVNMIHCKDTHSFVHRCFDAFKKCKDKNEAQKVAFDIIKDMQKEFFVRGKK